MISPILVTGSAGFIGFHLSKNLLINNKSVVGFDNLNNYYTKQLKLSRIDEIKNVSSIKKINFDFVEGDLKNKEFLLKLFKLYQPKIVVHLAAQAGVRYSIQNPLSYVESNLIGFSNILECCKEFSIENFIFASSSSVYGGNKKIPFKEEDTVDHPISLYAATKKSNEVIAHSYSHLFGLPCTGLRFFTVYGPWGRPDMAPMIFTKSILEKKPIKIFNFGNMTRDFTYIDDVIEILMRLINKPATKNNNFDFSNPSSCSSWAPYKIFNISNNKPIKLIDFIKEIESNLGIEAIKQYEAIQPGDVKATYGDIDKIIAWTGYTPKVNISEGVKKFINWYKDYYL
jgi:UDP-glucuronate 4-epimerase